MFYASSYSTCCHPNGESNTNTKNSIVFGLIISRGRKKINTRLTSPNILEINYLRIGSLDESSIRSISTVTLSKKSTNNNWKVKFTRRNVWISMNSLAAKYDRHTETVSFFSKQKSTHVNHSNNCIVNNLFSNFPNLWRIFRY